MKLTVEKIFAVQKIDGHINIVSLCKGSNIEEEISKWPDVLKSVVVSYSEINKEEIPEDRYFRNAWSIHNGAVSVDMNKAQEIHLNNIRSKRDEKLKFLDVETMRGIDVQEQKQVLRDIPQNFDLSMAKTPDELKSLWPDELK